MRRIETTASEKDLPSIWQLRVFEAVARHENVTQASQELLRSQPATTSCIAALEKILGVALFERSPTGTYLTPVGVAALVRTRKILQFAEEAAQLVGSTRKVSPLALASSITRTQMRCLIAIEECGSFRAAARMLGITEASLQRAARTLEQNLGGQLYRHTSSGINTTEVGTEFARRLKFVSSQIAALVETVNAYEFPKERTVTVGVLLLDPTILIVNAIRSLTEQFPDARVVVLSGTYETLLNKLLRGEIDFMLGLLKQPGKAFDFVEEPLYHETLLRGGEPRASVDAAERHHRRFADALSMGAAAQRLAAPRSVRTYLCRNYAAGGEHRDLLAVDHPHHVVRRGNADRAELDRGAERTPLRLYRAAAGGRAVGRPDRRHHDETRLAAE